MLQDIGVDGVGALLHSGGAANVPRHHGVGQQKPWLPDVALRRRDLSVQRQQDFNIHHRPLHHAVGVGAHLVRPGDLPDAGDGQLQAVLPGNGGKTSRGAVRDVVLFDTGVFHLLLTYHRVYIRRVFSIRRGSFPNCIILKLRRAGKGKVFRRTCSKIILPA